MFIIIMMHFGWRCTSRFTVTKYFRWDGNYLVSLWLIFGANDLTTRWKPDSWSRIWFVTGWQKLGVWKLTASKHIWQKWAPKIRVSNSWPNHEIFDDAGSTLNSVVIQEWVWAKNTLYRRVSSADVVHKKRVVICGRWQHVFRGVIFWAKTKTQISEIDRWCFIFHVVIF